MSFSRLLRNPSWRAFGLALALPLLAGCEDALLDYADPDIIPDVTSASGALALRNGVILRFSQMASGSQGPDALFEYGGLLADEWRSGDTFEQRNTADQRSMTETNTFLAGPFRSLNRVRVEGQAAINALRTYNPNPSSNIGLMFALTAFANNLAGETYCNGIPFSSLSGGTQLYGDPVGIDSAFKLAAAASDSAVLYTGGTDGPRVTNLAKIVKARALLNLGRFADVTAALNGVPTTYSFSIYHSLNTNSNQNWSLNTSAARYVVADQEGGTGLPYITAHDPRVPVTNGNRKAFDTTTDFYFQTLWGRTDSVIAASGIEARLMEAEAALKLGDAATWLTKLNQARATRNDLPPLVDPGTETARLNLMYYERGFWMFGTGHRLGDMRRLIRVYGRAANTVFPTGAYHKGGGTYGTDVNLPISFEERQNPNFDGCINRDA